MDYICIYEAIDYPSWIFWSEFLFWPLLLTPIVICIIKMIKKRRKWYDTICPVMILLIMLVVSIDSLVNSCGTEPFYDKYVNGECLIVEGKINEYSPATSDLQGEAVDFFEVNNVEFYVPDQFSDYSLRQIDGGRLNKGQYVKIWYCTWRNDNVIMRIDLCNKSPKQ